MKRNMILRLALVFIIIVPTCIFAGTEKKEISKEELIVATPYEPSIDPHFYYTSYNAAYARDVFDALTNRDSEANLIPSLASDWKILDETTWEFNIRKGVKFHDGSYLTAEDIVFSFNRIPQVPNNPASYVVNVNMIDSVEIKDPYTIIIKTKYPYPMLGNRISDVFIVSKKLVENASTADFTSGKVAIGTGPYKFMEYIPGESYIIERNEDYWGEKPAFKRVVFKIIPNSSARVAALISGEVDIIENLEPILMETVEKAKNCKVLKRPSSRDLFLEIDSFRDQSPFVTDKNENTLPNNPLKDPRVRWALSMAIDRDTIIDNVLNGLGEKNNQLIPKGWYSHNEEIEEIKYDPEKAKNLLKEAGYTDGFGLTIHGPNDRYINDAQVIQAIAQMWSKIGIKTKVETMPKSVYFGRLNKHEFSVGLLGWESSMLGSSLMVLSACCHSYDKDKGYGTWNAGDYYNPEVDRLIEEANFSMNDKEREVLLNKAMKIIIDEQGVIPLYTQYIIMGARNDVEYEVRNDEHFDPVNAKPKND